MAKVNARTKSLFRKVYRYNWDDETDLLQKIIADKDCDKATALMIFWLGGPDYYYNNKHGNEFEDYEIEGYEFLKEIADKILSDTYPVKISYEPDPMLLPEVLGNIPKELALPVVGLIDYEEALYPNNNPFDNEITDLCRKCTSIDEMYELERKGANFNLQINKGYYFPFELAVKCGNMEAIRYFIEKGFNINKKYEKEPLLFHALDKNVEVIKLLLDNGANIKLKGEFGRSVLHAIAVLYYYNETIEENAKYLISQGADLNAKDSCKETILELAIKREKEEYIQLINAYNEANKSAPKVKAVRKKTVVPQKKDKASDIFKPIGEKKPWWKFW